MLCNKSVRSIFHEHPKENSHTMTCLYYKENLKYSTLCLRGACQLQYFSCLSKWESKSAQFMLIFFRILEPSLHFNGLNPSLMMQRHSIILESNAEGSLSSNTGYQLRYRKMYSMLPVLRVKKNRFSSRVMS